MTTDVTTEPDIPPAPWSSLTAEQRRELVRELVERKGLSMSQAGEVVGSNRNAIAGVISRSKKTAEPIVMKNGPGRSAQALDNRLAVEAEKPRPRKLAPKPERLPPIVEPPTPPQPFTARPGAWEALLGSSPVALEQHVNGCRWPIGPDDQPYLFCNESTLTGQVYCPAHTTLGTRPLLHDDRRLLRPPKAH